MSTVRKLLVAVSAEAPSETLRHLKVFSEAVSLASRNYVDEIDMSQLERGAAQGLVESLDPWSSYYDPDRMAPLLSRDLGGDVGLLLVKLPQQYVNVAAIVPGGPADEALVRRGQAVEAIDGIETRNMTLLEAQTMLRGPLGSTVRLAFFRERGKPPRTVELTRRSLEPLRVVTEALGSGVALVRVTDVRPGMAARAAAELSRLVQEGARGFVLDLRNNVGGDPAEAAALARLFASPGPLFQRRDRKATTVESATGEPVHSGPLAVLVGRGTVGEAELVAAALRERAGARLVGQPTIGKTTQQDLVTLSDGSGLYMTIAEYLGADGQPLPKGGLVPDEKVAEPSPGLDDEDGAAGAGEAGAIEESPAPGAGEPELPRSPQEREVEGPLPPAGGASPRGGLAVPPRDSDAELQKALEIVTAAFTKKPA
jgi:carboxyl-terminal processing protease